MRFLDIKSQFQDTNTIGWLNTYSLPEHKTKQPPPKKTHYNKYSGNQTSSFQSPHLVVETEAVPDRWDNPELIC